MRHDTPSQLIAAANPVNVSADAANSPEARAALQRILLDPAAATVEPPHRRRWTYVVAGLATAASVMVALPLFSGTNAPVFAATPPLLSASHTPTPTGATAALRSLAETVSALPDDVGSGSVAQVSMQSWSLFTRINGSEVQSEVVPQAETIRTQPDGTTSVLTEYTYQGEAYEENFSTRDQLNYPISGLSSNDNELARQLAIGQPASNGTAGSFDSIVQAYRQAPIEPATRAAILRFVASRDGVETIGTVKDRLGREGVGFTVDSSYSGLPTRYTLIFDTQDGRLLGYEEMLTSDAGKLNVRTPAVIQYIAFEKSEFVD